MNISEIIWLEDIVAKLKWKHNVDEHEVIEIFNNKSLFRFIEKGHRKDENVYAALGQTNSGRYLTVFFVFKPKLSDFLLDLRRSLAHKGFAKILDISTGMPAVFANPYASRSQHISSQKIAQLRLKKQNKR